MLLWASKAEKGSRHRYVFNYADMREENGGKQMQTVWKFGAAGRAEKKHGKHPTQKPLALIDRCLRASTNPGDVVLDPFTGSGSTGVAAISLGRSFIGIESVEEYVEMAAKRLGEVVTARDAMNQDVADSPPSSPRLFERPRRRYGSK